MNKSNCFAEVIESCLDHYTAQCWQWDNFPTFGNLVYTQDKTKRIFGLITHIQTGSNDPTRTPFPYQKTEEELKAQQPQIFEFLRTIFNVQVVGYQKLDGSEHVIYLLPPTPCKIHAFITHTPIELSSQFFAQTDYLHLLFAFAANIPNMDELLLAIVHNGLANNIFDHQKIDELCKKFSLLTGNDYRRLKGFLSRIEQSL
jgi:hypothetical protein